MLSCMGALVLIYVPAVSLMLGCPCTDLPCLDSQLGLGRLHHTHDK